MKVLHIISSSGLYGAEAVILNMSRMLVDSSGTPASLARLLQTPPTQITSCTRRALKDGFESHLIPCNGQVDRTTIAANPRASDTKPGADIVHAHGFKADIYVYLAMRGSPVPFVSTCHTWYDNDLLVTLYGKLDRFVLRNFARVVAVSEEVKQRLLKAGMRAERIRIVRNGIDLRPFDGAAPSIRDDSATLHVGLIGRLAWEKGVDVFLSSLPPTS